MARLPPPHPLLAFAFARFSSSAAFCRPDRVHTLRVLSALVLRLSRRPLLVVLARARRAPTVCGLSSCRACTLSRSCTASSSCPCAQSLCSSILPPPPPLSWREGPPMPTRRPSANRRACLLSWAYRPSRPDTLCRVLLAWRARRRPIHDLLLRRAPPCRAYSRVPRGAFPPRWAPRHVRAGQRVLGILPVLWPSYFALSRPAYASFLGRGVDLQCFSFVYPRAPWRARALLVVPTCHRAVQFLLLV